MKAPVREFVEHFNHNVISVVQFETRTAMERADDLPSVKGVDISMLGPADLSISLGVSGQFDPPWWFRPSNAWSRTATNAESYPGFKCGERR